MSQTRDEHAMTESRSRGPAARVWRVLALLVWVVGLAAGCDDGESAPGLGMHEVAAPGINADSENGHELDRHDRRDGAAQPAALATDSRHEDRPATRAAKETGPAFADDAYKRWAVLVATNQTDEARGLCTTWLEDPNPSYRVEAHKCLANVVIAEGRLPHSRDLNPNATAYQPRIKAASVDEAVAHYEAVLVISPLEPDAHMGRMDVLILASRFRDANMALDETLTTFETRELLDRWFKLLGRFRQLGKYEEALAYLQVIEKHHPLDHRVVANLAAYYAMLEDYDQALIYSEKSVLLDPDDPINRWNLARLYDGRGELDRADEAYVEALALFQGADPRAPCDYFDFLLTRLNDVTRACNYAESNCQEKFESICQDAS